MILTQELKGIIMAKGKTQEDIAEILDMAPRTFYSRMKKGIFGTDEVEKMVEVLDIKDPMAIFFAK